MKKNNNLISWGIGTSLFSKIVTFLFQIVIFPTLIIYLGEKDFAVMTLMIAIAGWINLINAGISPYLTKVIVEKEELNQLRKVMDSSRTIILLFICFFIFISTFLIIFKDYFGFKETGVELSALIVMGLLILYFSIADSVRQGLLQQHINNLINAFSTLISVGLIICLVYYDLAIYSKTFSIVFCIYAPLLLLKMISFLMLRKQFFQKKYFLNPFLNLDLFKFIGFMMISNLYISLSNQIIKTSSLFSLSFVNLDYVVQMEILFRFITLISAISITLHPILWPIYVNAFKENQFRWIKKTTSILIFAYVIYAATVMTIFYIFGTDIFKLWLRSDIIPKNIIDLSLVYFLPTLFLQLVMILLFGLGKFVEVGKAFIFEALFFFLATFILTNLVEYNLQINLILMVISRLLILPYLIDKLFKSKFNGAANNAV